MPALFASAITSSSFFEPPGCTIAFTPALINTSTASAKGKNASEAATLFFDLSFAPSTANFAAETLFT